MRAPPVVALDSNVWGAVVAPRPNEALLDWFDRLIRSGRRVVVPEVVDFEVRRSLLRLQIGRRRWELYEDALDGVLYAPISTPSMRRAAEVWADARLKGQPFTTDERLDGDAVLIGQVLMLAPRNRIAVATTNVRHVGLYVSAARWQDLEV